MRETRCPLCDAPRPRGAKRCACNYMFEYDKPERGRSTRRPAGARDPALFLFVAIICGAITALLAPVSNGAGLILIASGCFSVCGAIFDWGWFMEARKARLVGAIVGRLGARVFYAAIGGALAGMGIAGLA